MVALLITGMFVAAALFAGISIAATVQRYGAQALALPGELAITEAKRAFDYRLVEHRTLRGDLNVVILPIRKGSYRLIQPAGLRAAA